MSEDRKLRLERQLVSAKARYLVPFETRGCIQLSVPDGIVLVGSDAHIWPGPATTAWRALVHMCTDTQPAAVILNGDIFDGARVSRWAAAQWVEYERLPTVEEELVACELRLRELVVAASRAKRLWTLGNHDSRFERAIMAGAEEYAGVYGTHLKDHFPDWTPAMEVRINSDTDHMVQVKHRYKSGPYAPRLNTLNAGVSIVTGHLHSQKVMPFSDLRGVRYGVDAGMLAAPYGPQFYAYTEGNSADWRSGFAVLTFRGGELLAPELVTVKDEEAGLVAWRGEIVEV